MFECSEEMYEAFKKSLIEASDSETQRDVYMNAIEAAVAASKTDVAPADGEVEELKNNMNSWMHCAAERLQMWTDSQSELTKAREDLRLEKIVSKAMSTQANDWAALAAQRKADLTKALELFADLVSSPDAVMVPLHLWKRVQEFAHQSAPDCEHEWVDARNEYVKSGEICAKLCGAIRPGNQSAPAAKVCQQPQAHPARCGCEQENT